MPSRLRIPCLLFVLLFATSAQRVPGQAAAVNANAPSKGKTMHAKGTFQVDVKPVEPSAIAQAADTGRMTIDKTWFGDIAGTSKGEMLTGITKSTGSMAYVAIERMDVSINGRAGTFLFQHAATMMHGDAASSVLNVAVVPNSGTGALAGLTGTLQITITGKEHHYDFAYELPG